MSALARQPETETTPVPMAEHVRRLVETWPPLTPEQSERIAVLLRPGGASA
ncbi:hypothetical protein PSET11_02223 [Arthrobacter ulcerisalmonis]|uniref:Uncharacterized protein n=1 Tax=Arthrobacter ulcerisalmonis TaxID=2483813 RepID=A0A3P5X3R9_9MICC|nr:hypothetical protein [Arthrobacter ulcerisalmonis]VDC29159.1 hypothetical protein PSET11_02223 [Arthrobacter ulcerisalmonis]